MLLKEYVPPYLSTNRIFNINYDIQQGELDISNKNIKDIVKQCFVETATWGLNYWDKFVGLNTQKYDIQVRRNLIKSKLIMQPPFTKSMLTDLLDNFVENSEIIEHNSEYSFDVILKTKDELRENLNFIIKQIELGKPAHLDYHIIIDYLTELTIKCIFNRYVSEELDFCGTIDISGNSIDINMGRSYKELIIQKFNRYLSDTMLQTGADVFIENVQGRSYKENIIDKLNRYSGEVLLQVSDSTFIQNIQGRSYNEKILDSMKRYLSLPFLVCSENTFVGEVI